MTDPTDLDGLSAKILNRTHRVGAGGDIATSTPIHQQPLVQVHRLGLHTGDTVIWKRLGGPRVGEAPLLRHLHRTGLRVPEVLASVSNGMWDGMLLRDLGQHTTTPPDDVLTDPAVTMLLVGIHATPPPPTLPVMDSARLAELPALALSHLQALRAVGRWPHSDDLPTDLTQLARIAATRSTDARLAPFGLCHGAFDHNAIFIDTTATVYTLGWARAFHGPGLLDLASPHPTTADPLQPTTATQVRDRIEEYIAAGGEPAAAHQRAGPPPERWALGWRRTLQIEQTLHRSAAWLAPTTTTPITAWSAKGCAKH